MDLRGVRQTMTTKRPYAPGRTYGHATQYVIDYLRTCKEATAREIALASEVRPRAAGHIERILRRYPRLFEEIGERDGRTVWALVE